MAWNDQNMQNNGGMQNQQPQPQFMGQNPLQMNPAAGGQSVPVAQSMPGGVPAGIPATPMASQPVLPMQPVQPMAPVQGQPVAGPAYGAVPPAQPGQMPGPAPMGPATPMGPSPAALRQVAGGEAESTNNDILWVNRAKRAIAESQGDPFRQVQLIQQLRVLFLKERYGHNIQTKDN